MTAEPSDDTDLILNIVDDNPIIAHSPAKSRPPAIHSLNQSVVHRLCSGQVIYDLSQTVKELIENSLDAGASTIEIAVKQHGTDSLTVTDNGHGITSDNYASIGKKYHTSKLSQFSDLASIGTFGFRGEALSSLCSLAHVNVLTRHASDRVGCQLTFDSHGRCASQQSVMRNVGTTVTLTDLFYSLPVRRKTFLKNAKRDYHRMIDTVSSYAMIVRGVRFHLSHSINGQRQTVLTTQGSQSQLDAINAVYGGKQAENLQSVQCPLNHWLADTESDNGERIDLNGYGSYHLSGYVNKLGVGAGRSGNDRHTLAINDRPVDVPRIDRAVIDAYRHCNGASNFPCYILNLKIPSHAYDVNVTPNKRVVLIHGESVLALAVKSVLIGVWQQQQSLYKVQPIQSFRTQSPVKNYSDSEETGPSVSLQSTPQLVDRSVWDDPLLSQLERNSNTDDSDANADDNEEEEESKAEARVKFEPSVEMIEDERSVKRRHPFLSQLSQQEAARSQSAPPSPAKCRKIAGVVNPTGQPRTTSMTTSCGTTFSIQAYQPAPLHPSSHSQSASSTSTSSANGTQPVSVPLRRTNSIPPSPPPQPLSALTTRTIDVDIDRIEQYWKQHRHTGTNLRTPRVSECTGSDHVVMNSSSPPPLTVSSPQLSDTRHRSISKSDFSLMSDAVIGQFNLGFIVCRLHDDLWIIDQHAADEKYKFESYRRHLQSSIHSQQCLTTLPLHLTPSQSSIALQHRAMIEKFGFGLVVDGSDRVVGIDRIPHYHSHTFGVEDVHAILAVLNQDLTQDDNDRHTHTQHSRSHSSSDDDSGNDSVVEFPRLRAVLASRACRSAVMIGESLPVTAMRTIISHMSEMSQPWNCPHGRPTMRHLLDMRAIQPLASK